MQRLRESYSISRGQVKLLKESDLDQTTLEKINKIKESIGKVDSSEVINAGLEYKTHLTESDAAALDNILTDLKKTGISSDFKLWKIPVARYGNMNNNNRIYTKELWENVKKNQCGAWQGLCGLADHPIEDDDPGLFRDQAVLWHDMDIADDGQVYGYCSFVGPYGHMAQEILEHGGRIGTSSSGFGDVDKVTYVVDPETYIIERLADLVLNPSQQTFGSSSSPSKSFTSDVNKGATMEFEKKTPIVEATNQNIRSEILMQKSNDSLKFDAAAQNTNQQAQQPDQTANQENKLTKVEEKAFRQYVNTFISQAGSIENPIKRLNECVDILSCFDEGNCPDLKESLEAKIVEEKNRLEALVESVVETEKEYDMDFKSFKEAAERNTVQGILLNEQVADLEELIKQLSTRNKSLTEKNASLEKRLRVQSKLSERQNLKSNKEVSASVGKVSKLEKIIESKDSKISSLENRVAHLSAANKEFEKKNGILEGKIHEAANIMKNKTSSIKETKLESVNMRGEISKLEEHINDLKKENMVLKQKYKSQCDRFDKLFENFENYKKEVNDTFNPTVRMMPKFEERVGKYLNFRENKGVEIESYWSDLVEKYGSRIYEFEDQIRGAKTLREATNNFLKLRTRIDEDFATAQPAEYAFRNRAERAQLYEHQGIINPVDVYNSMTVEQRNEEFLDKLRQQGLN